MADNSITAAYGVPFTTPVFDKDFIAYSGSVIGGGSKVFTNTVLKYRQRLNGYEITFTINGNTTASGGGATVLQIPLPAGALIDYAALGLNILGADSNDEGFGYDYGITSAGNYTPLAAVVPYTTSTIAFIRSGIAGYISGANINNTNAVQIGGKVWVPIVGLSSYAANGMGLATSTKPGGVYRTPQTALTVTGTGWSTVRAMATAYMDNNGVWRMTFNIYGNASAATRTSYSVTLSGTTFKAGYTNGQAISGYTASGASINTVFTGDGGSSLNIIHASISTSFYGFSGDVELDSKPTWA